MLFKLVSLFKHPSHARRICLESAKRSATNAIPMMSVHQARSVARCAVCKGMRREGKVDKELFSIFVLSKIQVRMKMQWSSEYI